MAQDVVLCSSKTFVTDQRGEIVVRNYRKRGYMTQGWKLEGVRSSAEVEREKEK